MNPASATPQHYTADRIADALGKSRQSVRQVLAAVPPGGVVMVSGNETAGWAFTALPAAVQQELQARAAKHGARSAEDLLRRQSTPWASPIPLDQIGAPFLQRAAKLRAALGLPLARQHELSRGALNELGLAEFSREFGYSISLKQWRRLFERAVWRDAGAENFQRLDIYLDASALRQPSSERRSKKLVFLHRALDEIISNLENAAKPTDDDRQWLFDAAFGHFEKLLAEHPEKREQRALKSSLIVFLFSSVPGLSKTEKALRRVFELKYKEWREAGRRPASLADERRLKSGNSRKPDFAADERKIIGEAILHGGSESLAHRRLREQGKLSPEFTEYYAFDPRRDKSRVPRTVRKAITPQVEMCGPLHRGPWEAKMRGPYIPRDWSSVQPGGTIFQPTM